MSRRLQAGWPRRGRWCGGADGSVSLLLVVAGFGLLIAVGLVVDGGQKLRSSQRADDAASEAARAAVLSIEPGSTVRGGRPRVDESAARDAAEAYLQRVGVSGSVTVGDGQVQVRTTTPAAAPRPPRLRPAAHDRSRNVSRLEVAV